MKLLWEAIKLIINTMEGLWETAKDYQLKELILETIKSIIIK